MIIPKTKVLRKLPQKEPFVFGPNQKALLMPMGDIHFGAAGFPINHFKDTVKWATDRGCYFVAVGDWLDFTSTSQRAIIDMLRGSTKREISDGVLARVDELLEILEPTKGRWLGMVEGNHTWTFEDGTNIEQRMCAYLGCDYLGTSGIVRLRFEDCPSNHPEADVIVYIHHGKGSSAQTAGGHLIAPERVMKWLLCDLVLMGHDHAKIPAPIDQLYLTRDNVLVHKTTIIARTGSYMKGYDGKKPLPLDMPASDSRGSYVERGLYPPSSIGSLCFSLGWETIDGSRDLRPVIHGSF